MNDQLIKIDTAILEAIKGVSVECCGSAGMRYLEDAQQFCENWLYENSDIRIDSEDMQQVMNELEYSETQAQQQLAVDQAASAWLDSLEYVGNEHGSISFEPIW